MTRKRFIKLLMAEGYSRNKANALAECARSGAGMKYSTAYAAVSVADGLNATQIDAICDAVGKIIDVAVKVTSALTKAAAAFAKTYREEMEATNE